MLIEPAYSCDFCGAHMLDHKLENSLIFLVQNRHKYLPSFQSPLCSIERRLKMRRKILAAAAILAALLLSIGVLPSLTRSNPTKAEVTCSRREIQRKSRIGVVLQDFVIQKVQPGTPAESAGLKAGDVISTLNGTPVSSVEDFRQFIGESEPGASLSIEYDRLGAAEMASTRHRVKLTTVPVPGVGQVSSDKSQTLATLECPSGCCACCRGSGCCRDRPNDTGIAVCVFNGSCIGPICA